MNPLSKFNHIPWKYVIGMNLSVLALAVTFASLKPTTSTTEHRSQAKVTLPSPLLKPSFDPQNPPELINPDIDWAKIGDATLIRGKNLGTVPFGTLKIGQIIIPHDYLIAWEPNQIVLTIPESAVTAPITLTYANSLGDTTTLTTKSPLTITDKNKR